MRGDRSDQLPWTHPTTLRAWWPGGTGGLGFSQMKEVAFLQQKYPKYRDFGAAGGFKEISAREFEEANALNRAQIYTSATDAQHRRAYLVLHEASQSILMRVDRICYL